MFTVQAVILYLAQSQSSAVEMNIYKVNIFSVGPRHISWRYKCINDPSVVGGLIGVRLPGNCAGTNHPLFVVGLMGV